MKVLLPVDGSSHSDAAVESVVNSPWPEDTTFCVITVAEPLHVLVDQCFGGLGQMALKAQEALDDDIHKVLAEAADKLRAKFGADKVTDEYKEGVASDQILVKAESWKADLIVMGSHGTGGYNDAGRGSVCMSVIAYAPCSVRIVQDLNSRSLEKKVESKAPFSQSRVLLPINGSKNSRAALAEVLNRPWPKEAKAQVLVVVPTKAKLLIRDFSRRQKFLIVSRSCTKAKKARQKSSPKSLPKNWRRSSARAIQVFMFLKARCAVLFCKSLTIGRRTSSLWARTIRIKT